MGRRCETSLIAGDWISRSESGVLHHCTAEVVYPLRRDYQAYCFDFCQWKTLNWKKKLKGFDFTRMCSTKKKRGRGREKKICTKVSNFNALLQTVWWLYVDSPHETELQEPVPRTPKYESSVWAFLENNVICQQKHRRYSAFRQYRQKIALPHETAGSGSFPVFLLVKFV